MMFLADADHVTCDKLSSHVESAPAIHNVDMAEPWIPTVNDLRVSTLTHMLKVVDNDTF
jgi:hypothetical protein